ncbi:MAG: DUF2796 domain-containing protein [Hyphomonas sp.]
MKRPSLAAISIFATALGLLPATASAQSLDAHVHGEANMAIVIEDHDLSVSLMSAMYNIIGFEHAPETDDQRETLQTAMILLDDGLQLFEINPAAQCTLTSSQHSLSHEEDRSDTDESEAEEAHPHNHRDLEADYEFFCRKPSKLTSVRVRLFDHFGNLQKVNVVTLVGGRQSAVVLTPEQETLSLAGS